MEVFIVMHYDYDVVHNYGIFDSEAKADAFVENFDSGTLYGPKPGDLVVEKHEVQ